MLPIAVLLREVALHALRVPFSQGHDSASLRQKYVRRGAQRNNECANSLCSCPLLFETAQFDLVRLCTLRRAVMVLKLLLHVPRYI